MSEPQRAADIPTTIPSPSNAPTSNIDPSSPAAAVAASAKDDLPTKTSWDEEELELDHYYLLGPNTPPRPGRKRRKTANVCFGKGSAMRLLPGHPGLNKGHTHQCTYPLPKETFKKDAFGKSVPFCGAFIKSGYDKQNTRWVSSNSSNHMKTFHPASIAGSMFKAGVVLSNKKVGITE